ncbi:hypothetical protein [Streptomyces virginiae]|uniref:Integral membrane protein n=1 Tax=Streptomyces virginiae TaxID=1961 RepID=A0ABZ1TS70_STRVG|nr:hypothetical protein [Streptomyces virginiae]
MSLSGTGGTPPSRLRRTWNWVKNAPRRAWHRTDLWMQDHSVLATTLALVLLLSGAGGSLWWWGELILDLARTYQPLFTILSIVIGAVLAVIKRFRDRRNARLAAAATTGSTEASTRTETTAAAAEPATITTTSPVVGEPPATETVPVAAELPGPTAAPIAASTTEPGSGGHVL